MSLTKTIQLAVGKMQVLKHHPIVCENISHLLNHEIDVMSFSKGDMMYEFEVKVTRGDFLADSKKRKWDEMYNSIEQYNPNYFSYVCPVGLINVDELKEGMGLYYYGEESAELWEAKKPKRIHKLKHERMKILEKVSRVNSERQFLGCCRLTYNNNLIKERNANR